MGRYVFYLTLWVLLGACTSLKKHGPIGFWSEQRYDKQLRKHGPWPAYYGSTNSQYLARGRYRHGRYAGRWRYYGPTGLIERTERFARRPYGLITITEYHANGKKWRHGQARIVAEPEGAHFYWFGEWQVFGLDEQLIGVERYERGVLRSKPITVEPSSVGATR